MSGVPATELANLKPPAIPVDSFFDVFAEAVVQDPAQIANLVSQTPVSQHIEHTVEFDTVLAPSPPQIYTKGVCNVNQLTPLCGHVTHQGAGSAAATLDILVNGFSILMPPGPVVIGTNPPGVPVPLALNPAPAPPNSKIDYIINDGGGALICPSVNVQWRKDFV